MLVKRGSPLLSIGWVTSCTVISSFILALQKNPIEHHEILDPKPSTVVKFGIKGLERGFLTKVSGARENFYLLYFLHKRYFLFFRFDLKFSSICCISCIYKTLKSQEIKYILQIACKVFHGNTSGGGGT